MMQNRPFNPFKAHDEKEYEAKRKAVEDALAAAGDRARICLGTEDFKKYREEYRRAEAKLIDFILDYNKNFHKSGGGDISHYAMTISTYLTRLEALRTLLVAISKEAQKGIKKAEATA